MRELEEKTIAVEDRNAKSVQSVEAEEKRPVRGETRLAMHVSCENKNAIKPCHSRNRKVGAEREARRKHVPTSET